MTNDKPTDNIVFNSETETISSKIRNKTRLSTLTTINQHSYGGFSHSNQRNKMHPNWKERSKMIIILLIDMI